MPLCFRVEPSSFLEMNSPHEKWQLDAIHVSMGQGFASVLLNRGAHSPWIRPLDTLYVWIHMKYLRINNPILLVDTVLSYRNPSVKLFRESIRTALAVSLCNHLWILA